MRISDWSSDVCSSDLRALAAPEKDSDLWAERFYEAMEDFRFLPTGRIIAGAGAARNVTLFTCSVMGNVPDAMSGISQHLREAELGSASRRESVCPYV